MSYLRSTIQSMSPYVPGEQPKVPGLIKLNTNENPYPPSPRVIAVVQAATTDALRLYPDPTASGLREKLSALHGLLSATFFVNFIFIFIFAPAVFNFFSGKFFIILILNDKV